MNIKRLVVAMGLALLSSSALAAPNWTGTADYKAASGAAGDEEKTGLFDTYDMGVGVALLHLTGMSGSTASYNGYYQSYVNSHTLGGVTAAAPLLDSSYELTSVANFTETITNVAPGFSTITVGSGSFKIYADTTKDRSFSGDSGFADGGLILSGTILGGSGSASAMSGVIIGVTQLNIRIDSYDHNVFDPDTIAGGNGIFTLRFGDSSDNPLLNPITQVQGVTYNVGDLKMAADGYVALTVPEPETWAMLVAGLGLVGLQLRRRTKTGMLSIN